MRILVGDDDPLVTHLVRAGLRAKGCEVTIAVDAMQVVMFAARTTPDAIILDINMPGGTGISALKRLKASATLSTIPVLVVSGSSDPAVPQNVRDLGAEGFLPKPLDLDAVYDALCRMIGVPPKPH
jgi:DNA-binding response OmpR family regulator